MEKTEDRLQQLEIENRQLKLQVKRLELQVLELTLLSIREQHPRLLNEAQVLEKELQELTTLKKDTEAQPTNVRRK